MFEPLSRFEDESPQGLPTAPMSAGRASETAALDPRLEDYLDHVCAPLVGLVPYARRQELRAELRAHVDALIGTHEELGSERDAAVVLALQQFGPPRELARQWARAWTHGPTPTRVEPAWRAMRVALGSFGLGTLAALLLMGAAMASPALSTQVSPAVFTTGMLSLIGILLPALAGLTTGLLAPARHALGAFFALALLILPSAALTLHPLVQPEPGGDLALGLALVQPLLWMPIGCGAAALGGLLRARLALRPRQWVLQ